MITYNLGAILSKQLINTQEDICLLPKIKGHITKNIESKLDNIRLEFIAKLYEQLNLHGLEDTKNNKLTNYSSNIDNSGIAKMLKG